jgi:hypothetical protein
MCEKDIYCLLVTMKGVVNIFLVRSVLEWTENKRQMVSPNRFRRLAHFLLILLRHIRGYFTFITQLFFIFYGCNTFQTFEIVFCMLNEHE